MAEVVVGWACTTTHVHRQLYLCRTSMRAADSPVSHAELLCAGHDCLAHFELLPSKLRSMSHVFQGLSDLRKRGIEYVQVGRQMTE